MRSGRDSFAGWLRASSLNLEFLKAKSQSWYPILAIGLGMMSLILIKSGRDAVFFQQNGLKQLPLAYIWIAAASIPAATVHLTAMDRWGARRSRTGLFFLSSFLFLLFSPFANEENRLLLVILYVLVPTIFAALLAGAWLLGGDLLEHAPENTRRWSYAGMGAAAMVGGIAGGLLARILSIFLSPQFLIAGGAAVLGFVGFLVRKAHRENPIEFTPAPRLAWKDSPRRMLNIMIRESDIVRKPYVLLLTGISAFGALVAMFIEFQFYAATMISGNNNAVFYASFYTIVSAASLLLQLRLAPWLQSRFGVFRSLTVLPITLLAIAVASPFLGLLQNRSVLRATEGGLRSSVYRSLWEQVFLPIERERREAVKAIVDGLFVRLADGVGAIILYFWISSVSYKAMQFNLNWMYWGTFGAVVIWLSFSVFLVRIGGPELAPSEIEIRPPECCPVASTIGKSFNR
ncbi:hypothetical protein L0152_04805 [bacterium]|nr:hypothetical protein [bacterium]